MSETRKARLIIGISGASGVILGVEALAQARAMGIETHLVMSKAGERTLRLETDFSPADVFAMADQHHSFKDIGASIASGSFQTAGMLVAPCSINSMSQIATGVTGSLLSRAADVVLKERRRLVLMVRETPLHLGHLRTMAQLSEMGAVIAPPVPAFYARPESLADMVRQSVARALDLFELAATNARRWGEDLSVQGRQDR